MSILFSIPDVARWTGGTAGGPSTGDPLTGVSTDTRSLEPGRLFLAIRGPNHDAHRFLEQALERGARALVVERGRATPSLLERVPVVEVADTTRALGDLAHGHRTGFSGPVVAITGSNGKTTTKEMTAAILASRAPGLKNEGNLNNLYGLPLTLLAREARHEWAVVELGTNQPGEIARLAAIAKPTVGVFLNVGTAHIERLGSREGIAREKGSLLEALPAQGVAVLNSDDELVRGEATRARARLLTFGIGPSAQVRADRIRALADRGFAFELVTPAGSCAVQVAGLGATTVPNALAAAAAALAAGASLDDISTGLARFRPVGGRMERVIAPRNVIVINDTYNANPQSMESALRSLVELKGASRGVAILGDMGELGSEALRAHAAIGRLVAELGVDYLFTVGELGREMARAAAEAGMPAERIHSGKEPAETASRVLEVVQGNDWVLVKGSRAMRMERIVESIAGGEAG